MSPLIDKIKQLTLALTPIRDMALLLDMSEYELTQLLQDYDSSESKAYRKTKAQVALEMRLSDIELAKAGSPTAAEKVNKYYSQMTLSE